MTAGPVEDDKRVEPLELFFDLVFVFALTQVTARMADDLSWAGLGRGMLILAAIWWAWAAYSWLTNEVDCRRRLVRLVIFASMACMLLASLAIPGAFEGDALLFAGAYLGARFLHVALFIAAADDVDVRAAAWALAPTAIVAPALLLLAGAFDAETQIAIWILALAIDYIGGALRGIEGWRLSPGHFAERYSLIVIIALGESIVAIGVGAGDVPLHAAELLAAALGVALVACLWSIYFDDALGDVEHRLLAIEGPRRNVVARDSFAFLHLPLIAGIVLLALGVKKTLGATDEPLKVVTAFALCGGAALFLISDVAFRRRSLAVLEIPRLLAAGACLALLPAARLADAPAALAAMAAICVGLVLYEARRAAPPNQHPLAPG